MLAFSSAGLIAALGVGIALLVQGDATLGWWLVFVAIAGAMVVFLTMFRGQRALMRLPHQTDSDSGVGEIPDRVLPNKGTGVAASVQRRWIGGASAPSALGYIEVSVLLAVAELGDHGFTLRVRPAIIRLMFGIMNLAVNPGEGAVIYPARTTFGRSGIEVRLSGQPSYYFWTGQRAELLASLAAAGFEVSTAEQRRRG